MSKAKILHLKAENVQRIAALNYSPEGHLIVIGGKNGAGKSSALNSIEWALRGAAALPSKPVRRGEEKAKIEMTLDGVFELGTITIKRTITPTGGGALQITDRDGAKLSSPQAILDSLFSSLSFDPLAFTGQSPKERAETLRALVGLDFEALDKERAEIYTQRTEANRVVSAKEAMLANNKRHPDVPEEPVSIAALQAELDEASKTNNANNQQRFKVESARSELMQADKRNHETFRGIEEVLDEIKRLQAKADAMQKVYEQQKEETGIMTAKIRQAEEHIAKLVDVDILPIRQKLAGAESTNLKVAKNKEVTRIAAELKEARKRSEELTAAIEKIDRQKKDSIKGTKFPVEGLTLSDENEVLFEGIPFDQCNTAQQIRVSVAMGLALNPKFPVLLIRRGSDLDPENLKMVADLAAAADAQVWLETSRSDAPLSVLIVDGHMEQQQITENTEPNEKRATA